MVSWSWEEAGVLYVTCVVVQVLDRLLGLLFRDARRLVLSEAVYIGGNDGKCTKIDCPDAGTASSVKSPIYMFDWSVCEFLI